jgi:DMSO/TMAO reductase YedYZ molybdopterin-dependent catalytic subunit
MAKEETLLDRVKQKLVETKQKWAGEGRLLTGTSADPGAQRLPPGQREVKNWPVLDLGIQPEIPLSKWRLDVTGAVENPLSWSWADFQAQPQIRLQSDIHCVTAWSRYDNHWEGVATRHLIDLVKPKPEAKFVIQHSYDGYTTNVTLGRPADRPCPWRAGAAGAAETLFLEEREMADQARVLRHGQAGLLGGARLSQSRRPLGRGAV